jgi:hypothetical protein
MHHRKPSSSLSVNRDPVRNSGRPGNQALQARMLRTSSRLIPIGAKNDKAERAAERVADRAISGLPAETNLISPRSAGTVFHTTGRPLHDHERARFDRHFGGLEHVRIHEDRATSDLARSMGARAFTVGNNIGFGVGQYSSRAASGEHLLAHELAHVAQNEGVIRRQPLEDEEEQQDEPVLQSQSPGLLSMNYSGPEACGGRPCFTDEALDEILQSEATEEQQVEEIASSMQPIATFGPFTFGVLPGATNLPPSSRMPPGVVSGPAPIGGSRVVQGSGDPLGTHPTLSNSIFSFANRTGQQPMGTGPQSFAGVEEITLVAHGTRPSLFGGTRVGMDGTFLTPEQLGDLMVGSGWKGGTLRMAVCHTGVGSFAQRLANHLAGLGAETVIIAPKGIATIGDGVHGLPQVLPRFRAAKVYNLLKLRKGWRYVSPDVPEPGAPKLSPFHPNTWTGAGWATTKMAAMIALSYFHARAVAERVEEQRNKTGYAPWGPTGNRIYDFGAWFLDPSDEAGRSIPLSQRFNLPVWRQQFAQRAADQPAGKEWKVAWQTSDVDPLGHPAYRTFYGIYVKRPDGFWMTVGCKDCEGKDFPADINLIVDPLVSDEDVRKHLEIPEFFELGNQA